MRDSEIRLRRLFAIGIALGWLSLVGLLTFAIPAFNRYTGRVVAISESARVMVLHDGRPESLRLAEIDFPEKGHPHAREARAYANRLALAARSSSKSRGSRTAVGLVTSPSRTAGA